jgi:hypothetical protein
MQMLKGELRVIYNQADISMNRDKEMPGTAQVKKTLSRICHSNGCRNIAVALWIN